MLDFNIDIIFQYLDSYNFFFKFRYANFTRENVYFYSGEINLKS